MNIRMNIKHNKATYRVRYVKMMENLAEVANMKPKGRYMHRLMDTVIFHDFETALSVVIEDFQEGHNDNKKSSQK